MVDGSVQDSVWSMRVEDIPPEKRIPVDPEKLFAILADPAGKRALVEVRENRERRCWLPQEGRLTR
jgi:hypothetical protein